MVDASWLISFFYAWKYFVSYNKKQFVKLNEVIRITNWRKFSDAATRMDWLNRVTQRPTFSSPLNFGSKGTPRTATHLSFLRPRVHLLIVSIYLVASITVKWKETYGDVSLKCNKNNNNCTEYPLLKCVKLCRKR